MRRRHFRLLLATTVVGVALAGTGTAGAQTTTTTSAPVPTTLAPVVPTTAPTPTTTRVTTPGVTTAPGSTVATTATTAPATVPTRAPTTTGTGGSGGGGFPWLIVLLVVVVAAVVGTLAAVSARRRGAHRQLLADWLREAADTTAEAGATVRLLAQGTPPTGPIAQQLVASLRAFDDLALRAPDEGTAADAERARRTLQNLGIVIDRAYRLRRSQPPPEAWALEQSEEAVRNAALDTDRTLRTVYRGFTAAD